MSEEGMSVKRGRDFNPLLPLLLPSSHPTAPHPSRSRNSHPHHRRSRSSSTTHPMAPTTTINTLFFILFFLVTSAISVTVEHRIERSIVHVPDNTPNLSSPLIGKNGGYILDQAPCLSAERCKTSQERTEQGTEENGTAKQRKEDDDGDIDVDVGDNDVGDKIRKTDRCLNQERCKRSQERTEQGTDDNGTAKQRREKDNDSDVVDVKGENDDGDKTTRNITQKKSEVDNDNDGDDIVKKGDKKTIRRRKEDKNAKVIDGDYKSTEKIRRRKNDDNDEDSDDAKVINGDDKSSEKIRRRRRDADDDDGEVEDGEDGGDDRGGGDDGGEELPEPEPLAWVNPDVLVRQGAQVEKVPSLANLVGVQVFKYRFPPTPQPSPPALRRNNQRPALLPALSAHPALNSKPRINNKPKIKSDTQGQFFGSEFHDRFDKYYKSLRKSDVPISPLVGIERMGGNQGRYNPNSGPHRPPYNRLNSPADNFLQLLNPFNLFGHNQFPQLPRYPYLLHPPGQQNFPPLPSDTQADATKKAKEVIEVVTDPNTDVYKGYHYKEDYPLREDLYIGQDGNIYFKSDYKNAHKPGKTSDQDSTQGHEFGKNPASPQDHLDDLKDSKTRPSHPHSSGRFGDERELSEDDLIIQEFFEGDEDGLDEEVSSYSELLSNHNLGNSNNNNLDNQFTSSYSEQGDHRIKNSPFPQHDSRQRFPPRYPYPTPPQNPPFARNPPPPWSQYSSFLDWLLPSFGRSTSPSFFYNPREVMLPRFRYLGPWGRSVLPPQGNGLLSPQPDYTQSRQPPIPTQSRQPLVPQPQKPLNSQPRQPPNSQPRHPSQTQSRPPLPSQPRHPLPSQPRQPPHSQSRQPPYSQNRPFPPRPQPSRPTIPNPPPSRIPPSPNRLPARPFNRPSLANQTPPRTSLSGTSFNRPQSRPSLSNSSPTRFPASRSPPQQYPSRRPSPHSIRPSAATPPHQRQVGGGRMRPGSASGFYPGDGFFDADFSSAFHMAQKQEKMDVGTGDEILPPSSSDKQSTTATPIDLTHAPNTNKNLTPST